MKHVLFIVGGARSGKSRYALTRAAPRTRKVFIATAAPFDGEMKRRIAAHRADRNPAFVTVEAPLDPATAIRKLPRDTEVAVVDCLTVWLGNLVHKYGAKAERFDETDAFLELIAKPPCNLVIVANEVGLGIVPAGKLARAFRDIAGRLNQEVAATADEVVFMVSGLPTTLKKPSTRGTHR